MVGNSDRSGGTLIRAHREELAEGRGADDRGLVLLRVRADTVGGAVAVDAADGLGAADAAGVVAVVLDDVVLC